MILRKTNRSSDISNYLLHQIDYAKLYRGSPKSSVCFFEDVLPFDYNPREAVSELHSLFIALFFHSSVIQISRRNRMNCERYTDSNFSDKSSRLSEADFFLRSYHPFQKKFMQMLDGKRQDKINILITVSRTKLYVCYAFKRLHRIRNGNVDLTRSNSKDDRTETNLQCESCLHRISKDTVQYSECLVDLLSNVKRTNK